MLHGYFTKYFQLGDETGALLCCQSLVHPKIQKTGNIYLKWRIRTNPSFAKLCCGWDCLFFLISHLFWPVLLDAGRSNHLNLVPESMSGWEALCTTNGQFNPGVTFYRYRVQGALGKACLAPPCIIMHLVRNSVFPNPTRGTSAPEHHSPWPEGKLCQPVL